MKPERKLLWTWIVVGVLFLVIGISQYIMFSNLQTSVLNVDSQLQQTTGTLQQNIETVDTKLEENTRALAQQLNLSVVSLEQDIQTQRLESLRKISGLEGKLTEGLEELQDQVVELNVKSQDFSAIIDDTLDSIVSIFTNLGVGSGVIVDEDGYVVTNYHVIQGVTEAGAQMYSGQIYPIRIVDIDLDADLALIQMDVDRVQALSFEPARNVKIGSKVIALGSPAGLEFTVTEGIISSVDRENENRVPIFQTDVPINPGNSGGPLVNSKGNIVGINTFKARGYEGLGFAVQSDVVRSFVLKAISEDQEE